jgi:hypothetical protein
LGARTCFHDGGAGWADAADTEVRMATQQPESIRDQKFAGISQGTLAITAIAAAALGLAGCTMTVTSDGIDLEKVVEALEAQTGGSVITLQCPEEDIPFEAGLVTVCPATQDGVTAVVSIVQVNDQGLADFFIGTTIDEDVVRSSMEVELGVPVELMCPADIPIQEGLVVDCGATVDGANARVEITQRDNLSNLDWKWSNTLDVDVLPSAIEAEIGVPVEVVCPEDIPLEEGLVVECLLTDGKTERVLVVTQKDNLGAINWMFE